MKKNTDRNISILQFQDPYSWVVSAIIVRDITHTHTHTHMHANIRLVSATYWPIISTSVHKVYFGRDKDYICFAEEKLFIIKNNFSLKIKFTPEKKYARR